MQSRFFGKSWVLCFLCHTALHTILCTRALRTALRFAFFTLHSAFCVLHSALAPRAPLCVLHSSLCVLHSAFFTLHLRFAHRSALAPRASLCVLRLRDGGAHCHSEREKLKTKPQIRGEESPSSNRPQAKAFRKDSFGKILL